VETVWSELLLLIARIYAQVEESGALAPHELMHEAMQAHTRLLDIGGAYEVIGEVNNVTRYQR